MLKAGDTLGDFIRRSRRIRSPSKIVSHFRHRSLGHTLQTMWHFSLDPRFHRVTYKSCANQCKQRKWQQRRRKNCWLLPLFCNWSAPGSVLKSGIIEIYGRRRGFIETQSLSWDDYCSHWAVHQISMAFLTTVWSNWFLFLRFRNNCRCLPPFWKVIVIIPPNLIG